MKDLSDDAAGHGACRGHGDDGNDVIMVNGGHGSGHGSGHTTGKGVYSLLSTYVFESEQSSETCGHRKICVVQSHCQLLDEFRRDFLHQRELGTTPSSVMDSYKIN